MHAPDATPSREEAQNYYEDFSLAVGLRDWLQPNRRHEALKFQVGDVLGRRRGLDIVDIGCGAGVMTAHLRRYGTVTGIDFSTAAIGAARRLAPGVTFLTGSLDDLPQGRRFDLITLFDVLEHIPAVERPAFLAGLRHRLVDEGIVLMSTPFPAQTSYRRRQGDDTLQIIDEEVELPSVVQEAAGVGLQLTRFEAYDVHKGSPEYQLMVFTTERAPGGPPILAGPRLRRRLRRRAGRAWRTGRKISHAARLLAAGHLSDSRWVLTAKPPRVRS